MSLIVSNSNMLPLRHRPRLDKLSNKNKEKIVKD